MHVNYMISSVRPRYILSICIKYVSATHLSNQAVSFLSDIAHAKISSSALFIIFVAVYSISPWPYLYIIITTVNCYSVDDSFHL
jgi:hypothetical protein